MFDTEEYSSDTSDEDFVPTSQGAENESEDPDSVDDDSNDENTKEEKHSKKIKQKKKKKGNPLLSHLEDPDNVTVEDNGVTGNEIRLEKTKEKDSDLWADFLADVEDKPISKSKPKKDSWASLLGNTKKSETQVVSEAKELNTDPDTTAVNKANGNKQGRVASQPTKVKVTKVFEFAGEEVRVEQEVASDSPEAQAALLKKAASTNNTLPGGLKRPVGLSGIAGFLDSKRQKLSTLEKTKFDWMKFKSDEGIEEELETHLKSKAGYLEKKEFLERTDHRQFELEKEMRTKSRSKR